MSLSRIVRVALVLISLVIIQISLFCISYFESKVFNTFVIADMANLPDKVISASSNNSKLHGVKLKKTTSEEDAIFKLVDSREYKYDTELYNKVDVGYTPMIAIFPFKLCDRNDNTYKNSNFSVMGSSSNHWFVGDLEPILNAIVESGTGKVKLSQFGYDSVTVTAFGHKSEIEVGIAIPSDNYTYRRDVVNQLIYTLNGGKSLEGMSDDELEILHNKLDNLLSKVENITSVSEAIGSVKDNESLIYILPESILNQTSETFCPVYFKNSYVKKYALLYPILNESDSTNNSDENSDELTKEDVLQVIDFFTTNNFVGGAYIRNKANVENSSQTHRYAATVDVINDNTDLKEVFGNDYWVKP